MACGRSVRNKVLALVVGTGAFGASMGLAPGSARADSYFDCEPVEVIERSNRIGVQCENPFPVGNDILNIDWIYFVTFPKTDQAQMERFIDFATKALIEGKYFRVLVPESSSGNISGCLEDDCRTVATPFSIKLK